MNLDVNKWKEFKFGNLIDKPYKAKAFKKDDLELAMGNGLHYITRTGVNNGCELIVNSLDIPKTCVEKGNAISIGDTTATCFYQEKDFIVGDHIVVVRAKWLNKWNGLFVVSILQKEQYKYSYGRAFLIDRIQETMIKLPIQHNPDGTPYIDITYAYSEDGYVPDWQFMENYMKSLHHKAITTNNKKQAYQIDTDTWKEFLFGSLISSIHKAKAINKDDIFKPENNDNAIPYITRTESNNGCEQLADINNIGSGYIEEGNAITIGDTTATCFYQKEDFIAGDHIVVVRADGWLNEYTGLFITTLLNNEKNKYSYGRAFLIDRIQDTVVKLPVDSSGNPDWKFMEDYIKSLPYGDRLP